MMYIWYFKSRIKRQLEKFDALSYFVLIIILLAFIARFYKFDIIPYGIHHDGAQDALQALQLKIKPWPYTIYFPGGSGESLFKYYLALFLAFFGVSVWTVKFASAVLSFLTVPFFYLFVKKLTNRTIALFSTFFITMSGWHIIMGKSVWRAISTPFIEVFLFYFALLTFKKDSIKSFIITGTFLGLSLHTYNGARSLPIFIFLVVLASLIKSRLEKTSYPELTKLFLLFIVPFLIISAPLLSYAYHNTREFNSRFSSLSVINRVKETQSIQPLVQNTKKTLLMFNKRAGGDDFFIEQPLLAQPASLLFLIGIFFSFFFIRKQVYLFSISGLVINLLPGLLSMPNGNRNIASLPFVYLFVGLGLYVVWKSFRKLFIKYHINPIVLVLYVMLIAIFNFYNVYFNPSSEEIIGFNQESTAVAYFMKRNHNKYDFYLTDNFGRDTLTFITYRGGGDPWARHYNWLEKREDFLKVTKKNKGIAFIMFDTEDNMSFIEDLENVFPGGQIMKKEYLERDAMRSAGLVYLVEYEEN